MEDVVVAEFDAEIDLGKLRERTSEKWSKYPRDILPLFVAESDFPPAEAITRALHAALRAGDLGYARPLGVGAAYAKFSRGRFGHHTDAADVFVIPEVIVGIAEILRTVTAPGDEIVINPPVYPPFFAVISEVGRRVREVPLIQQEGNVVLDFDGLEQAFASGARAFVFCNPHNPTGRVFSRTDVLRVATLSRRYDVTVLADEVHAPLVLPGAAHIPFESVVAETGARTITLTSASKGWNIAGLKCALAVSSSLWGRSVLQRLPGPSAERTGHLGIIGTVAAFSEANDYLNRVVRHLDQQRLALQTLFVQHGLQKIRYTPPQAGYLAWLDCKELALGTDPAAVFLKSGKVALVSGLDFGSQGAYHARLNFATSTPILREALTRMHHATAESSKGLFVGPPARPG